MKEHVSKVASSCFYQVRRLRQIRHLVGLEVTAQLVSVFILSRLDYCNSVLAGLPRCTTEPLQRVLNAAARLILNHRLHEHITPALQQLHWLPIDYRITYQLCLIMHLVHTSRAPQYLLDCVQTVAHSSRRPGLRSSDTLHQAEVQNQVWRARFLLCWTHLHQINVTSLFKCRLKTDLFRRAYHC